MIFSFSFDCNSRVFQRFCCSLVGDAKLGIALFYNFRLFCFLWNFDENIWRNLLRTEKLKIKDMHEKFVEKYCRYCFLFVKRMKADRPLLEPITTRVSAPSKVSWGLHSTRYVRQQPTWLPGVAGRCPGPRASPRARQRHGLVPDLLLTSPGTQRTRVFDRYFRAGETFPGFFMNYGNC